MRVSCRSTSSQAGSLGSAHAVAMSDQFVEVRIAVAADDHQLVAVEPLDAGTSIGDDLAQLRQDQVEDFGHAQRAPERLGGGAQRLGLFARGALGLEQPSILDRHRSLGGECSRELRELFGVDVGLELVDAEDADDAVADDHRGTDPSANASTAVQPDSQSAGSPTRRRRPVAASTARPGVEVGLVVEVEADCRSGLRDRRARARPRSRGGCPGSPGRNSCRTARLVAARLRIVSMVSSRLSVFPSTCVTAQSVSACSRARWSSVMSW